MINQYETVFIATPVLSEAQMKEAVDKYRKIITDAGGKIVHEENWGLKKLAYPIQKKSTGFYYLIEFQCEGQFIQKLETEYRRDERIIRFLTFKMDKYSIAYAEKKRTQDKEPGNKSPKNASEEKPKKEKVEVTESENTDVEDTVKEEDNDETVGNEETEVKNENTEE